MGLFGFGQRTKVAANGSRRITHRELNVGLSHYTGSLVERFTFKESAADGIVRGMLGLIGPGVDETGLARHVKVVDYRAIALPFNQILVPAMPFLVLWKRNPGGAKDYFHLVEGGSHDSERARFGQIETMAEVDDRSDDERCFDAPAEPIRMSLNELSPLQRSRRTILPKISAFPEPIVLVFAGPNRLPAAENFFSDHFVAPVKTQYERRRVHASAVFRAQLLLAGNETVLEQERAGGFRRGGDPARRLLDRTDFPPHFGFAGLGHYKRHERTQTDSADISIETPKLRPCPSHALVQLTNVQSSPRFRNQRFIFVLRWTRPGNPDDATRPPSFYNDKFTFLSGRDPGVSPLEVSFVPTFQRFGARPHRLQCKREFSSSGLTLSPAPCRVDGSKR